MKEWTKEERYRILKNHDEVKPLHHKIKESIYRQKYHIQPVTGLLNDPNGFVYHNNTWHLFYQWCPWGAVHGLKYWYKVQSKDLIHWQNNGVRIKPDRDYDNKGAYSGSALVTDNSIYLYYTGNHRDENWKRIPYTCIVNMRDDNTIHKYSQPLFGPQDGYTEHQRDPKIIYHKEKNKYYIMIGAQSNNKRGCVIFYESNEFNKNYYFKGELKVPGFEDFGDMWECPSIEHIDGYDVLIFCPQHITLDDRGTCPHHNGYLIGHMDYDTLTFTPIGQYHSLDFGFDSYAAECCANINDSSKAVLVAWMGLPDATYFTDKEDWSGCLTLPRELTIKNRRLMQKPLSGLIKLRDKEIDSSKLQLPRACEMIVNVNGDLQLSLFNEENNVGGFKINYSENTKTITIDRSQLTHKINQNWGENRTRVLNNSLKKLHIYIDSSSLEIFINDGETVFTSRVFPTSNEHFFSINENHSIQLWSLKEAVEDNFII